MRFLGFLMPISMLVALGCGDQAAGPWIDQVVPERALPGMVVQVIGEGFCGETADCRPPGFVSFGDDLAVVRDELEQWQDGELRLRIPEGLPSRAGWLVVTVAGQASNPIGFEVVAEASR